MASTDSLAYAFILLIPRAFMIRQPYYGEPSWFALLALWPFPRISYRSVDRIALLGPQDTSKGRNELGPQKLGFRLNRNLSPTQTQTPDSL
jgi:hypothetical protein